MREAVRSPVLLAGLLSHLSCAACGLSLCHGGGGGGGGGGGRVWQCLDGHNVCWQCRDDQGLTLCPLCSQPFLGLNSALMSVAQVIVGGRYKYGEEETDLTASSSMDFTLRAPEEEELEDSLDFAEPALDSLVEVKQLDI